MNIAEILRGLADKLENISSGGEEQGHHPMQQAELSPVDVDNTDNTESDTMVPPLQQKIELMKKMAGEESHYDGEGGCEECGAEPCECGGEDPLDAMKKMAGLPTATLMVATDEDEPFEG
jgi:hypothetical protein